MTSVCHLYNTASEKRFEYQYVTGSKCVDSVEREYMPAGITGLLSSLDFIAKGYNVCILGASDARKSYLQGLRKKLS